MSESFELSPEWEALREKILGLGERSLHKTFFPTLQLRLQELERFRTLLDHTNELILLLEGPSGRLIDFNEHARNRLGIALGETLESLLPKEDRTVLRPLFEQGIPGIRKSLETRLKSPHGPIPVEMTLFFEPFGETVLCVVVARDISERLEGERALRESEERYRTIFDATNDGLLLFAPLLETILDANRRALELFDIPPDAVGRRDFHHILAERSLAPFSVEKAETWVLKALEQGSVLFEWSMRVRGQVLWAEVSLRPASLLGKECLIAVFRDIGERKREEETRLRLEQERERNRAMQEAQHLKDNFLSVVSHELRTPLNAITGFGSILEDEVAGPLSPKQHDLIEKMLESSERMMSLVNNLLDVARMQAGRFHLSIHPSHYPPILERVVALLEPIAKKKGVRIEIASEVLRVLPLDEEKIGQVLINLIDNAIKFSPSGGLIRVEAREEAKGVVTEVSDQGIGIAPENLGKLFIPFHQLNMGLTRSVGGTGLGLSIAKGIIEAHGGKIEASSPGLGKGTTFRFFLPF